MHIVLSPAYGRDYNSKAAVLAAWNNFKDFIIEGFGDDAGRLTNKEDLASQTVNIRYNRLTKIVVIEP